MNIIYQLSYNNETTYCTGCTACSKICPKRAISMEQDEEGFLSPVVNGALCNDCGLCREICPACNPAYVNDKRPACYAALAPDELRQRKSSSGAAFPVLAQEFLRRGGAVCGAAFREDWSVAHIIVEDDAGLERLKGSKYVQSDLGDCFPRIRKLLDAGRPVLFSGTGCQVAGLKAYLRKEYPQLCTVDLICHGVPSPGVWHRYLEENFDVPSIGNINFRIKEPVWNPIAVMRMEDTKQHRIHRETMIDGTFYLGFIRNIILRKSCGKCMFNRLPRQGDITLGDYWGIHAIRPELDDGKGTSVVLVNTTKGNELIDSASIGFKIFQKLPLESALSGNPNITSSSVEHENRTGFFAKARQESVTEALHFAAGDISDCKIINYWFATNYGAVLTCYALQETLFSLGKSAKVVNFMPNYWRQNRKGSFSEDFSSRHLHLTRRLWNYEDLKKLNDVTESFIVGSDQVFRHDLYATHGGGVFQLDFVRPNKRRIACSASFGRFKFVAPPIEARRFQYNLAQFDAVSVREKLGVAIFEKMGIASTQIIEPVFYLSQRRWHELADCHTEEHDKCVLYFSLPYIKGTQQPPVLDIVSEALGVPVHIQVFDLQRSVEDWLDSIRKASFVVTDSFHGMCFAILFHRPFAVLGVYGEVRSRMDEVLGVLGLEERIIDAGKREGLEALLTPINWEQVDEIIEREKIRALAWLKDALGKPIRRKEYAGPRLDWLDADVSRLERDHAIILNRYPILAKYYVSKLLKKITFGQYRVRNTARFYKYQGLIMRLREIKKNPRF